jgi:hypothetical protein
MLCEDFADQTEASEIVQDDRMMSENNIQLMVDITLHFFLDKTCTVVDRLSVVNHVSFSEHTYPY